MGGLVRYRSENATVFEMWSLPFFIIIVVVGFATLLTIGMSCKQLFDPHAVGSISPAALCFDVAVLFWGVGYFVNSMDNPVDGGQIAELNALGSSLPFSTVTYWIAFAALVLGFAGSFVGKGQMTSTRSREIAFAVWCVAVVLVLSEGILRFRYVIAPETQGFPTYATDLWKRKHVKLNSTGFRDSEHPVGSVQQNVHRLLVVGDSYAFGWGLKQIEDRFGEQLVGKLTVLMGKKWESLNASRGDTHTLDHLEFLRHMLPFNPEIVILLYVFNDIDYLRSVTPRRGQSETPQSVVERLHPVRVLFKNFFLFQEAYVRARLHFYSSQYSDDPYEDMGAMNVHMNDISRFVSIAGEAGASVAVVPFEIGVIENEGIRSRYDKFVRRCVDHGIPVWPIKTDAFAGYDIQQLSVNVLDRHPNELANRLAAQAVFNEFASAYLSSKTEKYSLRHY